MSLKAGSALGSYEIVSTLGVGGMGEVYRAIDPRLHREVAVKVLSEEMAKDPERLERFEREARTIASLSHPNIVTIHSVEEADGLRFITMELVDGETLAELIPPGGLPLSRFFELAHPIVTALVAAHERGITHRDLKPENVMVGKDGRVRVLDFGLAKAQSIELPGDDAPTQVLTEAGRLLGTVPYMSPEQVKGGRADHRSDLFSMGVVLYEMATGERPFRGETSADVMSSILRDRPTSITELKADLPRHLARILRRCLEKEPLRRYQSALDLANELADLQREVDSGEALASRASIAVLPFVNMSADPEQEFFCDGMAEDVINALSRVDGIHVVARTSAFQFKGQDLDVRQVGEKLGVTTVLEGSVRKAGNRVRISAQLVNVANGYDLWSERFDRELEDVFAIQDEISLSIVETLKAKLVKPGRLEPKVGAPKHTPSTEVYELLLKGRFFRSSGSKDGYESAKHCFEQAIEADPEFAAAYADLSTCYSSLFTMGFFNMDEAFEKAERYALRALELDDSLAEPHRALAAVYGVLRWDWARAEEEILQAIEIEPGSADVHRGHAMNVLSPMGRLEEAVAAVRTAYRLDPLFPVSSRNLAENLYWSGRLEEALRQFQHTLEMAPGSPLSRGQLAAVYSALGDPGKALEVRQEDLRRAGRDEAADELGRAFAASGEEGVYRWYLAALEKRAETRPVSPYSRGILHGALGENDQAFRWLEKAYEAHFGLFVYVKVNPWLTGLHGDPRWGALMEKMGVA